MGQQGPVGQEGEWWMANGSEGRALRPGLGRDPTAPKQAEMERPGQWQGRDVP